jgi:hypothetical protein
MNPPPAQLRQKKAYPLDQDLESRIANCELAARMQLEAMKVADISNESAATLVESGVRFVEAAAAVTPPRSGAG